MEGTGGEKERVSVCEREREGGEGKKEVGERRRWKKRRKKERWKVGNRDMMMKKRK